MAAARLGLSAVEVCRQGRYVTEMGREVLIAEALETARAFKVSIPPEAVLPKGEGPAFPETVVQVTNETTLGAARRLTDRGLEPLALNFANGIHPGGLFSERRPVPGGSALPIQRALCDPRRRSHVPVAPQAVGVRLDGLGDPLSEGPGVSE